YFVNNLIAEHTDINDNGQTITFAQPKIKTTAKDKSTNTNQAYTSTKTTIVDTVKYTGLIIGKEYTVNGILMDKATNEPLIVNGQTVTASTTFVADISDGTVNVEFTFDSSALNSKSVVVFENIYYEENLIATHTDINDKNQTITFTDEEPPTEPGDDIDTDIDKDKISSDIPGDVISTGDDTTVYAVIATVITVICLGIIIISGRKKYDE
ncbi:MAG: VaFE repeat-containing surface-anchored protein, partial [Acutalibacteraceae bacterium]